MCDTGVLYDEIGLRRLLGCGASEEMLPTGTGSAGIRGFTAPYFPRAW